MEWEGEVAVVGGVVLLGERHHMAEVVAVVEPLLMVSPVEQPLMEEQEVVVEVQCPLLIQNKRVGQEALAGKLREALRGR